MPKPTWGYPEFINYLRQNLAGSVETDVRPLLARRGAFGVPRQFFPYIEYLSGLVFGPASVKDLGTTAHAEQFLVQYMTSEPLYGTHAWLLLNMWRHGTIHTYKPKLLEDPVKGRRLGWMSYYGPRKNATGSRRPGRR